ncbi:uncharacterized protein LOC132029714 [Lycium ferocissimum]|uniref:uncharacterized protein LOC132029714 n=1 Tax=Lycium ferocissimum TaxID=112874 RepID=UPI00281671E8|nr:uncharacterized protein LOC132029714 [Lycium ferocissimum]
MPDRKCFKCNDTRHFKRNCPRLRQGGQGTQFQAPRAPAPTREEGSYEGNHTQSGSGGHTAGRGGTQPNKGGFQSGRGGHHPNKVGAQTGQVNHSGSQATGGRFIVMPFLAKQRLRAQMQPLQIVIQRRLLDLIFSVRSEFDRFEGELLSMPGRLKIFLILDVYFISDIYDYFK